MKEGALTDLAPGSDRVILGRALAVEVGAAVGDTVTLLIPRGNEQTGEIAPRIRNFIVSGIFEVGLQDHDSVLALVHLDDARAFEGVMDSKALTGLRLKFADPLRAPEYAAHLATIAGADFRVRDWTVENAAYFRAIRIEKMMMTLIMLLIVAVAAFNIVAMLVMVVRAKRTDIAILRTLGLKPANVLGIFITQGLVIGWTGTVLGIFWGLLSAYNVGRIVPWLEQTLRFQIMDADVYYITRIPSEPHALDVVVIAVAAFLLTLLATLYPALRAARTQPAEALRYE
jgi:lipoprotein-releasing system permease protein